MQEAYADYVKNVANQGIFGVTLEYYDRLYLKDPTSGNSGTVFFDLLTSYKVWSCAFIFQALIAFFFSPSKSLSIMVVLHMFWDGIFPGGTTEWFYSFNKAWWKVLFHPTI